MSIEQKVGLEGCKQIVVESFNRITEYELLLWLLLVEHFVIIDEQILTAAAKVKSTKPFFAGCGKVICTSGLASSQEWVCTEEWPGGVG